MIQGLGGAMAQGITGAVKGSQMADQRRMQQQQLTMQMQAQQQSSEVKDTQIAQMQQQMQMQQAQFQQSQANLAKKDVYNAFDSKNMGAMNYALKENPILQKAFGGVQKLSHLDTTNPAHVNQSANMEEPYVAHYVDPTTGQLGETIIDMAPIKHKTGYSGYRANLDREMQMQELKLKEQVAKTDKVETEVVKTGLEVQKKAKEAVKATELEGLMKKPVEFANTLVAMTKMTDKSVAQAQALQGTEKMSTATKAELYGKVGFIKDSADVLKSLGATDRDAWTKVNVEAFKVGGDKLLLMNDAGRKDALNKIFLDTKLANLVARYVKSISGAAVTDEERSLFADMMSAGNWSTKEAAMASMSGFMNSLVSSHKNAIEPRAISHPGDYAKLRWSYDKVMNEPDIKGYIGSTYVEPTPGAPAVVTPTVKKEPSVLDKAFQDFIGKGN